jgi:hypothetical protein
MLNFLKKIFWLESNVLIPSPGIPDKIDSRPATYEHIREVQLLLNKVIIKLLNRSELHDRSKLISPEVEVFDEYTQKLEHSVYGSEEYSQFLKEMSVGLNHHWKNNRHHPEYFQNGIKDMNLIDIIEMLCDWKAASTRHSTGDINKSIEINQKRFGYSDELKKILLNTLEVFN